MNDLLRRQAATRTTMDRYRGKAFDWSRGITCVHLARFHLRQMGHQVPTVPRIRSALAARRALDSRGWADTSAMLDSLLPRIAPAQMLLGDLACAPSDTDGIGAIMVCAGPQKLLGWREDAASLVLLDVTLGELSGAWRV